MTEFSCGHAATEANTYIIPSSGRHACRECRAAYLKKYRAAHKERLLEQQREYRALHPEVARASCKRYRMANPEKIQAMMLTWADAHRGRIQASSKAYYVANAEAIKEHSREYYATHTEQVKVANDAYRAANLDQHNLNGRIAKHRRRAAGDLSKDDWLEVLAEFGNACLACGATERIEMDHIVPIIKGGLNMKDNLQPLCKRCNTRKTTKTIDYRYTQILFELAA